jgi:hypothetical protein
MSEAEVTRSGLKGVVPGRQATTGARGKHTGRDGAPTVPRAEFASYYGKPILNKPVWEPIDIAGYFFAGGLAGASSLLAAGAQATGRTGLARVSKIGAVAAGAASIVGLVHDLGRPERFLHMLRVFKPTSPMSVGSWLLAAYVPLTGVAAASAVTGRVPRLGALATGGAAALGPAVASYTAVLVADTAVPAWHDAHRELPYVFVGSAATAAGGLGLLAAPARQQGPARLMALLGVAGETLMFQRMRRRMGMVGEPYSSGKSGRFIRAGEVLSVAGAAGAALGRGRWSRPAGAALLAASACTRFGVFFTGVASAENPRYTVEPQRERLRGSVRQTPGNG